MLEEVRRNAALVASLVHYLWHGQPGVPWVGLQGGGAGVTAVLGWLRGTCRGGALGSGPCSGSHGRCFSTRR